jgi:uncharacterized protein (DUF2267 family)
VDYEGFLADVMGRGRLRTRDETEAVTIAVLRAIAEILPRAHVETFASSLHPDLMVFLRGAHEEPDPYFDGNLFLGWVLSTVDVTSGKDKTEGGLDYQVSYSQEEAEHRCRCVFAALKASMDSTQAELIAIHLPEEIQPLFNDA